MMSLKIRRQCDMLILWLIVLTIVSGCGGRRITTAVEDQAFRPGPSPVPVDEVTKVVPPTRVEESEVRLAERSSAPEPPAIPAPPPAEPPAELSDVYFDFDQYAIRGDARSALKRNADLLKSQPNQKLVIEGHCDERGTSAYNLVLGERRAQAAKQYLQDLGLALSQIQITSYGKERPFCTEHSEACWQSNRRTHFRQP
ncbi:MAG: peptidoglycan-associated lipoprotein Pal [Nitrospira sp.]|nr:peptidoglycan-associated lipoprotein Pal [Nitrospira sp.]MDH5195196.1 peptidoglycan-associated lipoprotein Pal [Nitrospira sp.]